MLGSDPADLPPHSGTGCQTGTAAMGRRADKQLWISQMKMNGTVASIVRNPPNN